MTKHFAEIIRGSETAGRGYLRDSAHNISIAELARRNGCGVHTLMRLFHRHLGVSPLEYRERIRHERACRLLQSPQFSIKEISEQLGYCSQLYFSSAFRKRTGVSPSAYRGPIGRANDTRHGRGRADSDFSQRTRTSV